MHTPTLSDIRNAGYRLSANMPEAVVSRCVEDIRRRYLLHYVTADDITSADTNSSIGRAWFALAFVRLLQADDFATRTGGEKKKFDYGEHLTWMRNAKADAATALKDLAAEFPRVSEVEDVCEIYFKNQLYH